MKTIGITLVFIIILNSVLLMSNHAVNMMRLLTIPPSPITTSILPGLTKDDFANASSASEFTRRIVLPHLADLGSLTCESTQDTTDQTLGGQSTSHPVSEITCINTEQIHNIIVNGNISSETLTIDGTAIVRGYLEVNSLFVLGESACLIVLGDIHIASFGDFISKVTILSILGNINLGESLPEEAAIFSAFALRRGRQWIAPNCFAPSAWIQAT